jgi:hypothetical protein
MRRIAILVFLMVMLVGCASQEPATNSGGLATTTAPADPWASTTTLDPGDLPYQLVRDTTYLGVKFYDDSVKPYNAYPELDHWRTVGKGPVGNEHGSVMLFRATTDQGRQDLVVMWVGPYSVATDAIRLTGDASRVHLDLSCDGQAAVLVFGPPVGKYQDVSDAIRAWRPGLDGTLIEFDPTGGNDAGVSPPDC